MQTELLEPNLLLITLASISGAVGLSLLFVGVLSAMLVAIGNRHYIAGGLIFMCFPLAFIYCFKYKKNSAYALKLLLPGALMFICFLALLGWELERLGLDFIDVMSSTKPVHGGVKSPGQ